MKMTRKKNAVPRAMPKRRQPAKPSRAASSSQRAETLEQRRARAAKIVAELKRLYPDATCALNHDSPLQLVAATILSAQCTDDRVNKVTPALFEQYPSTAHFAAADPAKLEKAIQSTGFFRNKAKSLIGMGRVACEKFDGEIPDTMEGLLELPGVARKTANVVLGTWFRKNEGVVVDTHIGRLATRMKLTWTSRDEKDAVRIEQDLMQVLPRDEWTFAGHALIWHGRKVCAARKPKCSQCTLAPHCPSAGSIADAQ